MPAAASSQLSELTLSWINAQLRLELSRRLEEDTPPRAIDFSSWQRQMIAAVSGLLSGFALVARSPFV